MSNYGNLRRRELRALPTYQYPQQLFYVTDPDVLVQGPLYKEEVEHQANNFGYGNAYGFEPATMMMVASLTTMAVKAKSDLDQAEASRQGQAMAAEAQLRANSQAQAQDQAANLAFQKRLPLIIVGVMATGILGLVAAVKLTGRK